MKRISAFLIALLLVCLCLPVMGTMAAEEKSFHVTHFNDNTSEGACVIFTEAYTGAIWWLHVAFEPVEGIENGYKIVDISDGTGAGNGLALTIPEGGFVWAANYGNDYPALGMGGTNYVNEATSSAITEAKTWAIGNILVIEGLDLENKTIPTTTPDTVWYDASYICTATFKPYEGAIPGLDDEESKDDTVSEEADTDTESQEADTDTESKADTESKTDNAEQSEETKDTDDGNNNVIIWVIVGVVVVAVIGAVIIVAKKKK